MKNLWIAMGAMIVSVAVCAQSSVVFNNRVGTEVDAPVRRADGTGAGHGFTAELVLVNADGSLTPLTPTTTFRTTSAAAAFYVKSVDVIIPNRAPGPVTLHMRFYNGTAYERSTIRGTSAAFTVTTVDPMLPGVNLIGLQGFGVQMPEPGTLGLSALGISLMLVRWRKSFPVNR